MKLLVVYLAEPVVRLRSKVNVNVKLLQDTDRIHNKHSDIGLLLTGLSKSIDPEQDILFTLPI